MVKILYAVKGNVIAIIGKDYQHSKIITRVYDCSKQKLKLKTQSERKTIKKAKTYLHNKFNLEDFNCLAPATFPTKKIKKNLLNKVKESCKDLIA